MADCVCHIAAEFPILRSMGIISASLRSGTDISIIETACGDQIALTGSTRGDFSMTAYAALPGAAPLMCPGNASVSFNWETKMSCEGGDIKLYVIPKGASRASIDGDVSSQISMTQIGDSYTTFNASASSGPHTPYLLSSHKDGYKFYYSGDPLSVSPEDGRSSKSIPFISGSIFPPGAELYLTSFSWSYTPPNVPTVSYSFIFVYNEGGLI
jgi:hypothetical protein